MHLVNGHKAMGKQQLSRCMYNLIHFFKILKMNIVHFHPDSNLIQPVISNNKPVPKKHVLSVVKWQITQVFEYLIVVWGWLQSKSSCKGTGITHKMPEVISSYIWLLQLPINYLKGKVIVNWRSLVNLHFHRRCLCHNGERIQKKKKVNVCIVLDFIGTGVFLSLKQLLACTVSSLLLAVGLNANASRPIYSR